MPAPSSPTSTPETYNIDPLIVRRLVNRNTKAIIPVHLFGQCAAMNAICRIGRGDSVPIIEDAAQSIGAEFDGRRAGSIGDIGCLSFYPTKNLGGAGDGGMLTPPTTTWPSGCGCRAGTGCSRATITGSWASTAGWIRSRPRCSTSSCRTSIAGRKCGKKTPTVITSYLRPPGSTASCNCRRAARGAAHVWNQYVVRVPDGNRDRLREWLGEAKIGSEIYYPVGLHQQECFRWLEYAPGDLPQTERAAQEVLALPIFPELTAEEQRLVVDRIAAFYAAGRGGHPLAAPKFLTHPAVEKRDPADK